MSQKEDLGLLYLNIYYVPLSASKSRTTVLLTSTRFGKGTDIHLHVYEVTLYKDKSLWVLLLTFPRRFFMSPRESRTSKKSYYLRRMFYHSTSLPTSVGFLRDTSSFNLGGDLPRSCVDTVCTHDNWYRVVSLA